MPEGTPPFCLNVPVLSHLSKQAVIDSEWIRIGPAFGIVRVKDEPALWAAQCAWFLIVEEPEKIVRLEELDSLAAIGVLKPTSMLVSLCFRYPVKGRTVEEARTRAIHERRPNESLHAYRPVAGG